MFDPGNGSSQGTAPCVSDLSGTSRHHSDPLAGHLTPFRRRSCLRPHHPNIFLLLYHHTELFSSELAYFCKNTLKRSHQAKPHAVEPHFIRRCIVLNINTIRSAKYNRNLLIILLAANCRQNSFPCYFALSSRLRRKNDKVELIEHKEDPVFQLFAEKRDLLTSSDVAPRYRGQYLRYGPRATT